MPGFKRRLGPGSAAPDDAVAREIDEEIRVHLEMRTQELIAKGMDAEHARREARRRFGDDGGARRRLLQGARRRARRQRWRAGWEGVAADVRLTFRNARRAPGFAAVAVLIFALGVGLTTVTFTLADHVLLRPLPYPDAQELVALWSVTEQRSSFPRVSMTNWVDWKQESETLARTAIHAVNRTAVATADDAFYVDAASVSGPFFRTLGSSFLVGRPFTEEEAQHDASLAVVSEGFWRRVLGAVRPLENAFLEVSGRRRQVIGVVPRGEAFPLDVEVWTPHPYWAGIGELRNNLNYEAVARLRDGVSVAQAHDELSAIADGIRARAPEGLYSWGVDVKPLREVVVGDTRNYLVPLTAAVGFLLLVACANLAGLSLARERRRARESAVHLALGAGRARLAWRAVTEHVVLALVGGGAGVVLAWLSLGPLVERVATILPRSQEVGFDLRVAAFGVAAALASGLLAGLIPALGGTRGETGRLISGWRGAVSGGRGLPGAVMVGTEIALAVMLLVAGGLLLRSLQAVLSHDLGYEPEGVITAGIHLTSDPYTAVSDPATGLFTGGMLERLEYWRQLIEQVEALPGVSGVAIANAIPTGEGGTGFIDVEGSEEREIGAGYRVVSDRYFEVLGIPLLGGRRFDATDARGTERVVVVNSAMAERYWPGVSPLGRRVRATSMEAWAYNGTAPWLTVVGVVGDLRHDGFEDTPAPEMYVLSRQMPIWLGDMTVVARAPSPTPELSNALRETMRAVDPSLAVEMGSMQERVAGLTAERRMLLAGVGLFAAAALLLVCLGIYGLMSFAAGEREREMAVRSVLGAESPRLVRLMLRGALQVVAVGGAAGLVAAYLFTGLLRRLLVDVGAADPLSYTGAVVLLGSVAMLAALIPSLRVSGRDPLETLRREV